MVTCHCIVYFLYDVRYTVCLNCDNVTTDLSGPGTQTMTDGITFSLYFITVIDSLVMCHRIVLLSVSMFCMIVK